MGQYYKPVCTELKEGIYSHEFDNGLKLMEHSYINNNFVNAAIILLAEQPLANKLGEYWDSKTRETKVIDWAGRWSRMPFVWCGDYADDNPDLPKDKEGKEQNWYHYAEDLKKPEVPNDVFNINVFFWSRMRVFNTTKFEYFDYWNYIRNASDDDGWLINPLPLLTCDGNGRGGGDYRGNDEVNNESIVGRWAYDKIHISLANGSGSYKDITPYLLGIKENRL